MTERVMKVILTALKTEIKYETVLDAGCGTGFYASKLSENGFLVTGIDYARGMIKVARKKHASRSIQYEIADLSKTLPYDNNSFDHAISISSLQAVPDPIFTLRELGRVVKQNGMIVIVHFGKPESHQRDVKKQVQTQLGNAQKPNFITKSLLYLKAFAERKGFSTYWTLEELKLLIERSGLTIRRAERI